MATNVHLTPEFERCARACVEGGRIDNLSDVARAGLRDPVGEAKAGNEN